MNSGKSAPGLETVERAVCGALTLQEASLVVYRSSVLVEFKTTLLQPGLVVTRERGRRTWQIGAFEGHHCHLNLALVTEVWFDAEPVSCQAGRLNYTVWFLSANDCGNPYRPKGMFSVTLNGPYREDGSPRLELIGAVYALYDSESHAAGISASEAFLAARPG